MRGIGGRADAADETAGTASIFGLLRALIARLVTLAAAILVPTANSTANANIRDVAGNKADAAAETADTVSIVGLLRALLARWTVSTADSTANVDAADVLGNKADAANVTASQASAIGLLRAALARIVGGVVSAAPTAAQGVQLTAGAADTWGDAAELAAASSITTDYRIVGIHIDTPSAGMAGLIQIGYGAGPTYILTKGFGFETDAGGDIRIDCQGQGGIIPANSVLVARIKTVSGSETLRAHAEHMPA